MDDIIRPVTHHSSSPAPKDRESAFQPPEVVADKEDELGQTTIPEAPQKPEGNKEKKSLKDRLTKKQWIILGVVTGIILICGTVGGIMAYKHHHAKKPAPVKAAIIKPVIQPKVVPTTVPSNLTGLPVDPSVNQRPVTGIMIENSTFARPQSGLDQAGVVFEAVAEGGITRFLALYQDNQPSYIGPVRSARPYYLQWLLGFDAPVAHVGESGEALADISAWNVKNLDQFYYSSYYERIPTRVAPHNVYTSISNLNALETKLGYTSSKYTSFARKAEQPSKQPNASTIDFTVSGPDYNVHYDYDTSLNSYKRSEGGAAHIDQVSGKQLEPKVVLALIMSQSLEADGIHTQYGTIGSGTMYAFQDGIVTQGTWHKSSINSQLTFTDANGNSLPLNAGQTWITVLGSTSDVSYK